MSKKKIVKTVGSSAFIILIFFVFNPLELYYTNISEFWFSSLELVPLILLPAIIVLAVLSGIGFFLRGKAADVYCALLIGLGIGFYIQGNFLNAGMQNLAGQEIDWCSDKRQLLLNCLFWLLCLALPQIITFYRKGRFRNILLVVVAATTAMQGASFCASAINTEPVSAEKTVQLTTDGLFKLSQEHNILVFIIDTFDATFYESLVQNNPSYGEWLSDFTYFDNAVAGGAPTHFGVPLLLTGIPYDGQLYESYKDTAYEQSNIYKKLRSNCYDTRIYTADEYISESFFESYIENAQVAEIGLHNKPGMVCSLYRFAAYKCFPNFLKNKVYFYSGDFEKYREVEFSDESSVYRFDDANFIKTFREKGISLTHTNGVFRVYHLFGMHGPYTLKANGTTDGTVTSLKEQSKGVMSFLTEFFLEMQDLGIYEDSTILIVGDHGAVDVYQNPCILVKIGQETTHTTRHTPVTFENILPTLSQAIDGHNDELNETLFDVSDDHTKIRYHVAEKGLVRQYTGDNTYRENMLFRIGYDARDTSQIVMIGAVKQTPTYSFDKAILFGSGNEGAACLESGFSDPEEEYVWCFEAAQLSFRTENDDRDLSVEFYFPSTFNGTQSITITAKEKILYTNDVVSDSTIKITIPREFISEDGTVTLKVFCPNAVSPASLGVSSDGRVLSVAFGSMRITPAS